jgi:hypothetical protein
MNMANGTQTQDKRIQFKPRKTSTEIIPDAPEGEWEFLIPKGKCKVTVTQKGDPRILVPHKLEKAADEKNEAFQGSEVQFSAIVFDDGDPEKRRGANMMKGRLRALCESVDVEFADLYPTEVNEAEDFDPLLRALEGKRGTCWTVHTKREAASGEMITETEIRYSKPGAGLVTKGADSDDDDRPSAKKGNAKKPGRR